MGKVLSVILLAIVGFGVYVYFNPELLANFPLLQEVLSRGASSTDAYKWQDPSGGWHYTTTPPPEGVPYERVEVRHDTNVLPPPPGSERD